MTKRPRAVSVPSLAGRVPADKPEPFDERGAGSANSSSRPRPSPASGRGGRGNATRTSLNQVRIIGGEHRRRVLHFPDAPGLRPTPDRVRETLFNWLGQELTGMTCLDAFAGSGALGFEAASRHAARVLMLESSRPACEALRKNRELLKMDRVEISQADALAWMRTAVEKFDLVFLDPPFTSGLIGQALPLAIGLLNPEGWVYVEQADRIAAPEGFIIHREGRAGLSRFALLRRS